MTKTDSKKLSWLIGEKGWITIAIAAFLTTGAGTLATILVPSAWKYMFNNYSVSINLKFEQRAENPEDFSAKLVATDKAGSLIDEVKTLRNTWISFKNIERPDVYVLEIFYNNKDNKLFYNKFFDLTKENSYVEELPFPKGWTSPARDVSALSRAVSEIPDLSSTAPIWMRIAYNELGVNENVNPSRVIEYFSATDFHTQQALPWAGAFVSWVLREAGFEPAEGGARAVNWKSYGEAIASPDEGAIVVFAPPPGTPSSGHVGFVVNADDQYVDVLGGNQADSVKVTRFPIGRVTAYRWPTMNPTSPPGE